MRSGIISQGNRFSKTHQAKGETCMKYFFALLATITFSICTFAADVAGIKIPDSAKVEGQELKLNGAGVRTRMFIKVYVAGLYLEQKANTADAVLGNKGVKRIALHIMRDLKADVFTSALHDGLTANNNAAEMAKIEDRIKEFNGILGGVGGVKKGDIVQLDYLPIAGTRVVINGDTKGAIGGDDFYRALMKVWLGEKPIDADLKRNLLGS
jgi:Chalcone isomerase-like